MQPMHTHVEKGQNAVSVDRCSESSKSGSWGPVQNAVHVDPCREERELQM